MTIAAIEPDSRADGAPFPARVVAWRPDGAGLDLRWSEHGVQRRGSAATLGGWTPEPGQDVLVLAGAGGTLYALGPLGRPAAPELSLADGGRARIDPESGALAVHGADGTALFRYEPGRLRIEAIGLDLRIAARGIDLDAEEDVTIRGRRVLMEGREAVSAGVPGEDAPRWRLDRAGMAVTCRRLSLHGASAGGEVADLDWVGRRWRARVEQASLTARRLETTAETVVENAGDVYRRATGVCQQSAGRLRQIVAGTLQVKAQRVLHRASEAFKVRSDKIHLG